jgi:hypothetical protein
MKSTQLNTGLEGFASENFVDLRTCYFDSVRLEEYLWRIQ